MMRSERRILGLDRVIRREWLDALGGHLAGGASLKDARGYVWKMLEGQVTGDTTSSARGKTLTVLAHVWLSVPEPARPLRDSALELFARVSAEERMAIHWALMSSAYPFFVDISSNIGKLIALNGECSLLQVTRRLVDLWGDRSTLRFAVQRVVRSMVDWGVLREGEGAGRYLPAQQRPAVQAEVAELLVEGFLIAEGRGMPLGQVLRHPAAFPFDIRIDPTRLRRNERLRIYRQGDQTDFVERA